eukprot:2376512-Amphidinium_carterae.1
MVAFEDGTDDLSTSHARSRIFRSLEFSCFSNTTQWCALVLLAVLAELVVFTTLCARTGRDFKRFEWRGYTERLAQKWSPTKHGERALPGGSSDVGSEYNVPPLQTGKNRHWKLVHVLERSGREMATVLGGQPSQIVS